MDPLSYYRPSGDVTRLAGEGRNSGQIAGKLNERETAAQANRRFHRPAGSEHHQQARHPRECQGPARRHHDLGPRRWAVGLYAELGMPTPHIQWIYRGWITERAHPGQEWIITRASSRCAIRERGTPPATTPRAPLGTTNGETGEKKEEGTGGPAVKDKSP